MTFSLHVSVQKAEGCPEQQGSIFITHYYCKGGGGKKRGREMDREKERGQQRGGAMREREGQRERGGSEREREGEREREK